MRCTCLLFALASLSVACGSDSKTPSTAQDVSSVNAAGSAGSGNEAVAALPMSGLPVLASSAVAKPAGAAGGLKVLDWAGQKAAMTYTFDDSNRSQMKHYAELQALGVHLSFYLITSKPESLDPVWVQAVADGHEVANHTQSHLQMGDTIAADTDLGNTFLENTFHIKVYTMAAPYGTLAYADVARTRYLINRGVGDGLIAPNGANDPFNLNCYIPAANTLATTFNAKVEAARSAGSWQTVLVHGFTDMDAAEGAYQPVDFNEFVAGVNYAKAAGDVWIDSTVNIGAYWLGAKAFNLTPPTTSGDTTTWSWTLPEHFPPGKYLRVSVDGGTLKQDGKSLPWDPQGFYEIALDEGTLTLSP